jgi:glycosyltransferase involved in cell wall biosynthesis
MSSSVAVISIGLPVHNGENYLQEAIASVAAQTFRDYEVYLCDNGSTDATPEICRAWAAKDARFRYFPANGNHGAAWNFNRTFEMCHSPYFVWLAHDDRWRPRLLEECWRAMEREPRAALCHARSVFIDEQGAELAPFVSNLNLDDERPDQRFYRFLERYARPDFCNPVFGLFRASALRRTAVLGPYPGSDMILLGEIALAGLVLELPEVLFERRDHPKRSLRACTTDAEVADWFLPESGKKRQHVLRKWGYEYARAIARADLSLQERLRCYEALIRLYVAPLLPGLGRKIAHEAVKAPRQVIDRLVSPGSS